MEKSKFSKDFVQDLIDPNKKGESLINKDINSEKPNVSTKKFTSSIFQITKDQNKEKKEKLDKETESIILRQKVNYYIKRIFDNCILKINLEIESKKIENKNRSNSIQFVSQIFNEIIVKEKNHFNKCNVDFNKEIIKCNQTDQNPIITNKEVKDLNKIVNVWNNLNLCLSNQLEINGKRSKKFYDLIIDKHQKINLFPLEVSKNFDIQSFFFNINPKFHNSFFNFVKENDFTIYSNPTQKNTTKKLIQIEKLNSLNSFNNYKIPMSQSNLENSFLFPKSYPKETNYESKNKFRPKTTIKINDLLFERSKKRKISINKLKDVPEEIREIIDTDISVLKNPQIIKTKVSSTDELVEKLKKNLEVFFAEFYDNKINYEKLFEKINIELVQIMNLLMSNKSLKEKIFTKICNEDKIKLNILNDVLKAIIRNQSCKEIKQSNSKFGGKNDEKNLVVNKN